jgi:hypothetical protein
LIYRPQFKYPTPPGFRDVPHEYYMVSAGIAAGVPANSTTGLIAFALDDDADFYCRAITGDLNNGATNGFLRLVDPFGIDLFGNSQSSGAAPDNFLLIETVIGGMAGPAYILNEEIWCPRGCTWQYALRNPLGTTMPAVVPILRGVKRCRGCAV